MLVFISPPPAFYKIIAIACTEHSYETISAWFLTAFISTSSSTVASPLILNVEQINTESCSVFNSLAKFSGVTEYRNKEIICCYTGKQKFISLL